MPTTKRPRSPADGIKVADSLTFMRFVQRKKGERGVGARSEIGEATSGELVTSSQHRDTDSRASGHMSGLIGNIITKVTGNLDPFRRRIVTGYRRTRLARWIGGIIENWQDYHSEQAKEKRIEAKARDKLWKVIMADAMEAEERLTNKLSQLGFYYDPPGRYARRQKVRFDVIMPDSQGNTIWFHASELPEGIWNTRLVQQDVVNELMGSVGRPIEAFYSEYTGLIYGIERAGSRGIPDMVGFLNMVREMPQNMPLLAYPAGITAGGRAVYLDLADAPHLLIAGGSGKGKSNSENFVICSLILRNTPDTLRLILLDLKGGVEFGPYERLPHLLKMELAEWDGKPWKCNGLVELPGDIAPALKWLQVECYRRLDLLRRTSSSNRPCKTIVEYNQIRKEKLPYVVVIMDEAAVASRKAGSMFGDLLSELTNLARAVGIHFVMAAQAPKASIMDTEITGNFQHRFAFAMKQGPSMSVLGSHRAVGLSPKGRAILQTPEEEDIEIQTPRITNQTVVQIVRAVMQGKAETIYKTEKAVTLDIEEILRWALLNKDGKLEVKALYGQFKQSIKQAELEQLLIASDNQNYTILGRTYTIIPPAGRRARRMELFTG